MGINYNPANSGQIVDDYINTAYDTVKVVADNIAALVKLAGLTGSHQASDTEPTTRPDGSDLESGDTYFNTATSVTYTWNDTSDSWVAMTDTAVVSEVVTVDATMASTGTITLTNSYAVGDTGINVFLQGVFQTSGVDYTETDSHTLDFGSDILLEGELISVVIGTVLTVSSLGALTHETLFTTTASQAAGSVGYTIPESIKPSKKSDLNVYVQGTKQASTAYAYDSVTGIITFSGEYPDEGDEVQIINGTLINSIDIATADDVEYTPAGGVATNVGSKLGEWVSVTDFDTPQEAYDHAYSIGTLYDSDGDGRSFNQELTNNPTVVWPAGTYTLTSTLLVKYGIATICEAGCIIKAGTNGMVMVRTQNAAETPASGLRGFRWSGGLIAGDNKAKCGLQAHRTLNGNSISGLKISGCNYANGDYTIVGTVAIDDTTINLVSASGLEVNDVLHNIDTGQFFNVETIVGNVITVPKVTVEMVAKTLNHVSVGFQSVSAQEWPIYDLNVTRCTVGIYNGTDLSGRVSASLTYYHPWVTWNDFAFVNNGASDVHVYGGGLTSSTKGSEVTNQNVVACGFDRVHLESSQFTDDADLGGSVANSTLMESIPLVNNLSGRGVLLSACRFAPNTGVSEWRRFLYNAATYCEVIGLSLGGTTIGENPNQAGDYALFEQQSTGGSEINIVDVANITSQYANITDLIITEAGAIPVATLYSISTVLGGIRLKAGVGSSVTAAGTTSVVCDVGVEGDAHPRLEVRGRGELVFGIGTAAADTSLRAVAADTLGLNSGDSIRLDKSADSVSGQVTSTIQLRDANNVLYHLWVDSSGDLKIHTSKPSDELATGTVVGTQS